MIKRVFFYFLLAISLASCSNTKFLNSNQSLYTGATVKVKGPEGVNTKRVISPVEEVIKPDPNRTFLGMWVRLYFYNIGDSSSNANFLKRAFAKRGEEPVLLSDVNPARTETLIRNRLQNLGHFHSEVSSEIIKKRRRAKVIYSVVLDEPYRLKSYKLSSDSTDLMRNIQLAIRRTRLRPNRIYDLNQLKTERERIDNFLKKSGYYNFNADYLKFLIDTAQNSNEFTMVLDVKKGVTPAYLKPYNIRNTKVISNYSLSNPDTNVVFKDFKGRFMYYDPSETYRPELFNRYIYWDKGTIYNIEDHQLTINRFIGLGMFQYATVYFEEVKDSTSNWLDAYIQLTPAKKKSLRLEASAVSKSNNFAGPALVGTYKNKNVFKGGEQLNIAVNLGFETQLSRLPGQNLNSIEVGLSSELVFARFLAPWEPLEKVTRQVHQTKISAAIELLNRTQFFRLNSYKMSLGYNWFETPKKQHDWKPIVLNLVQLANTSESFEEILSGNPLLRRSFDQQFIIGSSYGFTYNGLLDRSKHNIYYNGIVDFSGNVAGLAFRTFTGEVQNPEEPNTILGTPFAQFTRITNDVRYYYRINRKSQIVARTYAGVGFSYGNSSTMPFVKQFFTGGPNSIRAFRVRSLGPGTYRPDSISAETFFDQSGDIKIEGNLEYRFPIYSIVNGAIFTDVGNLWNINENPNTPGGKFTSNWYKQLAVGTGFGIRADASFFIIRLDLAFPLVKPWLPENERLVAQKIALGDKTWRRENLVLNIAIGYPF